ncbi:ABC transporter substrate-binding protein [Flexivirga caeni]|uniref:ABC transporter substrate-binding protein n=1 Tax=Flexivirga caeni TaxID=2294115 RepID=A0A3M9M8H6_9MICO|nr:ABC transporter substrate-binding protein [Flexivirga caeni]RNI20848.1 ABC transporter substrate-binding protein [Flexivirga caeni]
MKTRAISLLAVACLALGTAACSSSGGGSKSGSGTAGASTGGSSASASAKGTVGNIAQGVATDPAAVKLLPASVKSKGSISVAMDLQYPPTSFLSTNNQPEGYNVDIARLIAAKLGLKLHIENVSFDTIITGLQGGRYDFTTTNMSATPDRLKALDMINYWKDGSSLATKSGNPENLDINTTSICGKKIAVMTGTTQQQTYLPALSKKCSAAGKPAAQAVVLPNVNGALTQLASGRIDGIFYDTPSLAYAVQQHGSTFSVGAKQYNKPPSLGTDLVAIGLPKNSPLTKAIQAAMQSIIDSPLYLKALNNWGLGSGAIKTASIATAAAG